MAPRRAVLLHARLIAIARQCEVAHHRGGATLTDTGAWSTAAVSHGTAHEALRIAAGSLAAQGCCWTAGRGFAAHAETVTDAESSTVDLQFTSAAVERLGELAGETPGQPLVLRLTVEGGGCSGFTYHFNLDQQAAPDDRVVSKGDVTLVCDPVSYEFVQGSTIDYTTDIIRSAFEVVENPNAEQSCGCGSSFAPKG